MSERRDISGPLDDLDRFLSETEEEGEGLIDPGTLPFSDSVPRSMRELNRVPLGSSRTSDQFRPECSGTHRGHKLSGIPSLMGSSLRDGIAIPGDSVTVILARETLQMAFPAGWASYRSPEFNSHLRGALVFWPWKDYDAPADLEQSVRRVLELHEIHASGKTIEVACHGGHGRTGTLLAILAALHKGWPKEEAVDRLRKAYCVRAVESKSQERFVVAILAMVRAIMKRGGE